MNSAAVGARRPPIIASAIVVGALLALIITAVQGLPARHLVPLVLVAVVLAVGYRTLLQWHALLAFLVLVILFIPIRRYTLPGSLPFELEPYRLVAAFVIAGWCASLLVDGRVRLRRTSCEGPLIALTCVVLASVLVNPGRVAAASDVVGKKLVFFASFFLIFYLIVSVVRSFDQAVVVVKVLVAGGALVALLTIIENRTAYNFFDHLQGLVPLVQFGETPYVAPGRGARLRAYGSAEHPIAMGAAFVLLLPLAIFLARGRRLRWWIAGALLGLGALATQSRTAIVMLVALGFIYLLLRPRETFRFWPAIVPFLVIVHLVMPATIGPIKDSFFPAGGLLQEQRSSEGSIGQGRIADLGPALDEFARTPVLGQGFGTRIPGANSQILDDQWLGVLLETGMFGAFAWLWLFSRFLRKTGKEARRDFSPRGWLLTAVTASVAAYAIGMFTFDAFGFVQITFLLFILLGIGAAMAKVGPDGGPGVPAIRG